MGGHISLGNPMQLAHISRAIHRTRHSQPLHMVKGLVKTKCIFQMEVKGILQPHLDISALMPIMTPNRQSWHPSIVNPGMTG